MLREKVEALQKTQVKAVSKYHDDNENSNDDDTRDKIILRIYAPYLDTEYDKRFDGAPTNEKILKPCKKQWSVRIFEGFYLKAEGMS